MKAVAELASWARAAGAVLFTILVFATGAMLAWHLADPILVLSGITSRARVLRRRTRPAVVAAVRTESALGAVRALVSANAGELAHCANLAAAIRAAACWSIRILTMVAQLAFGLSALVLVLAAVAKITLRLTRLGLELALVTLEAV